MIKKSISVLISLMLIITTVSCGKEGAGGAEASSETASAEKASMENASMEKASMENASMENASSEAVPAETEATAAEIEATEAAPSAEAAEAVLSAEGASDGSALVKSVNSLNFAIFERLGKKENLFYSPYSIAAAVALADLAAKEETKEGIEKAISIADLQAFERDLKAYVEKNEAETGAVLNTANAVWIDESLKLSGDYEKVFKLPALEFFKGEFFQANFSTGLEKVQSEIKKWISEKTDGFISDYESGATRDTVADIINAVYFYGEWENKFAGEDTLKEPFHGDSGDTIVDMMVNKKRPLRYIKDLDGISALAFPYRDSTIEMDIFIPADGQEKGISDLFNASNAEKLFAELDKAEKKEISVFKLPKFQMDVDMEGLVGILKALGMEAAFSESADFSGLASQMRISDIKHRAKLEVDEEGSRAAAVTDIEMEITSLQPIGEEVRFIVDKPFIFAIRDRENGLILFMGRVNEL